jgi:hypothetical protein
MNTEETLKEIHNEWDAGKCTVLTPKPVQDREDSKLKPVPEGEDSTPPDHWDTDENAHGPSVTKKTKKSLYKWFKKKFFFKRTQKKQQEIDPSEATQICDKDQGDLELRSYQSQCMSLEDLQLRFEEFDKLDQNPHQQVKSTQHVQDVTNESFEDIEIWREDVKKQKDTKEEIPHSL